MSKKRIDVHFHAIASEAYAILTDLGIHEVGSVQLPQWNEIETLAFMDRNLIETAILSTSDFPIPSSALPQIHQIARVSNDFYADLIAKNPKRFGAFAALPLHDVEASLKEISYALDTLHLDGVMLLSNYEGIYLGDPVIEPIMDELNRRKVVTFIHPGAPLVDPRMRLDLPIWLVEYPINTTRAVTNLIVSGSFSRHADIHFILAHAGGAIPYITQRLLVGYLQQHEHMDPQTPLPLPEAIQKFQSFRKMMRRFYCDAAMSTFPSTMSTLRTVIGTSHILFGSDYPYAPEKVLQVSNKFLNNYPPLDFIGHNQIARQNALGLFPRIAATHSEKGVYV
ncbi:MAG: amidohydrolase family protein [Anaerolineales bacterium]